MIGADQYKEILLKYYKERPILLYGDPDVDGLIVLKLLVDFANYLGIPEYMYYVNDNREHGFKLPVDKLRGYLVISGDFGITQKEMQNLVDNDVVVLATDHHECQEDFIYCQSETAVGLMINNQYPFEPEDNRYLSGAGVFYELICSLFPDFRTEEREALIGITLISDACPIENNQRAKTYLKKTYRADTTTGYIKHLVCDATDSDSYSFGVPKLDNTYIGFTLSPVINSLLRFDMKAEAINFILDNELSDYTTRNKQKQLVSLMMAKANILEMPNIHILSVDVEDILEKFPGVRPQNFIGAVCNKYQNLHGYTSILGFVKDKSGQVLRTSFRGRYSDVNYLRGYKGHGYNAGGHPSAFGIKDFEPKPDDWSKMQDLVADLEAEHLPTHKVIEVSSLIMALTKMGSAVATNNCFVRDAYRTYFKYTGNNYRIRKETYKMEAFTTDDYLLRKKPDKTVDGVAYKYLLDVDGNKIPQYIEYEVDGRMVKSFGTPLEEGLILPLLEGGYMQLYVKEQI